MELGTEIGKMTRKLFTGFSKNRPWMLDTGDQMAAHRRSDRHCSRKYCSRDQHNGRRNTAVGVQALGNLVSGFDNIAIWLNAGFSLNSGEARNIDIDHSGVAGENATIRIGTLQTRTLAGIHGVSEGGMGILPVYINSEGQLGTSASSRRFKKEIQPMDTGSEVILQLKPVTFQYRNDNTSTPQFGLIAEEVAEVNPDLVVRDKDGEIYTVRYEAVNAMLLNELLKEHRTVNELRATVTQQQKQLEALTAGLQKGLRNST